MKPGCKNAPVLTRARRGRAAPAREGRRGSDRQRALTFRVSPLAQQHRTTEAVGRNGTRPQAGRKARQRRARFWHRRTGSAGGNKKQRAERRRGRRHGAATAYAPEVDSDAVLEQSDRVLPVSARGRPWEKPEAKAANRPRIEGPAPRARSSGSDADEVRTAATVSSAAYSNIEVEFIARIGKGLPSGGLRTGKRGLMNFFLLQRKKPRRRLVMLPWAAVRLQRLGMQDREDPNGWHICATESHFPDQNFKTSGYWPIDGHHGALEADGVAVSRWNLVYPLLPLDA